MGSLAGGWTTVNMKRGDTEWEARARDKTHEFEWTWDANLLVLYSFLTVEDDDDRCRRSKINDLFIYL